jgi:hypothetical protein
MMKNELRWVAVLAVVAALAGCGDDEEEAAVPDPAELACEEVDEAGESIEASTERDESAPEIELGGEPFAVALSDTEPTYVRVDITEDTPALLLLGTEDAVAALYHEDDEEELVSAGPVEQCADEIPEHFDIDFHEAGTYYIELAPSASSTLWLLLSGAEGHGDDGHDDH